MVGLLGLVEAVSRPEIRPDVRSRVPVIVAPPPVVSGVEVAALPPTEAPQIADSGFQIPDLLPLAIEVAVPHVSSPLTTGTARERNGIPMAVATPDLEIPVLRPTLRLHPPGEVVAVAVRGVAASTPRAVMGNGVTDPSPDVPDVVDGAPQRAAAR